MLFLLKKLYAKIILGKKNRSKTLWSKKNVVQKIKVQRNLGPKKVLVQTNFGSKKFWVQKFLEKISGSKKSQKKIWDLPLKFGQN